MKQTIFKRILPVFLSMVMILGILSPIATVRASEPTEMTVSDGSGWWAGEGTGWAFSFTLAEALEGARGEWQELIDGMTYSVNSGTGVYVPIYTYTATELTFTVDLPQDVADGTKLTIDGTAPLLDVTVNPAATMIEETKFEKPVTLMKTGDTWTLVQPSQAQEVTVSEVLGDTAWSDANGWGIYLKLSEALEDVAAESWSLYTGMTYSINGETATEFYMYAGAGPADQVYFAIKDVDLPQNLADGTRLTLDGTATLYGGNGQFKFTEPLTLVRTSGVWIIEGSQSIQPTEVEVSGIQSVWGLNGDFWEITLNLTNSIEGVAPWTMLSGMTYTFGEEVNVPINVYVGDATNQLYFVPEQLPKDAQGKKLTLDGIGLTADGAKAIKFAEELTLKQMEGRWALEGTRPIDATQVTVSGVTSVWGVNGDFWEITLGLTNSIEGVASWTLFSGMTFSFGEEVGLPINVYVADEANQLYFVPEQLPKDVQGKKLTLSGIGLTADGAKAIKFAETLTLIQMEGRWVLEGTQPTQYTTVTVQNVQHSQWADRGQEKFWEITLKMEKPLEGVAPWTLFTGMTYTCGDDKNIPFYMYTGDTSDQLYFVLNLPKDVNGKTLTLNGEGVTADNTKGIKFANPIKLVGTAEGWFLDGHLPVYTNINVTRVDTATSYLESQDIWYVYLHTDKPMPGAIDSYFYGMKLEVNGKTYDVITQHALHMDTLCFPIEKEWLSKNAPNGTKITLKAGKGVQSDTGLGISLNKDVTLYKFYDTLTLKQPTTNTAYTDITFSGLAGAIGFIDLADAWCMELVPIQKIPGEEGTKFYYIDAVLNGKELKLKGTKQGECLLIEIPSSILPKSAKTATLTFKSRSKAVGGYGNIGINVTDDHTVYLFNGMWSDEKFDEMKKVDLACTRLFNVAEQKERFDLYFHVNGEFPGKAWYNVFTIQVDVDGRKVKASMYKADSTVGKVLYVGLPKEGTKIKEGTKMTIKDGTVAVSGGYQITIKEDFQIIYTNGMWVENRETDAKTPVAQNLWNVARFDSAYIPVSSDGTVMMTGEDDFNCITSMERMKDFTVSFSGKKLYDDAESSSFSLVLRGTPISEDDPVSTSVLNGYVITFEGYECTEETEPNRPELWGTRAGYVYVWKNGYNLALKDQYCIGMYQDTSADPFYKYNEAYNYEASIYNISETVVCIELRVNGELAYKCYDEAGSDPADPAINPGIFGIYGVAPTIYGGETVELETVLAAKTECVIGEDVSVAVTYPSILAGAEFTVDKDGAVIENGKFIATKVGIYTVSAKYHGKELKPIKITVKESDMEEDAANEGGLSIVATALTVAGTVVLAAGVTTVAVVAKKKKKRNSEG